MHPSEELLHAFLDGRVSAVEQRRVERHVTSCVRCKEELEGWRALFESLDELSSHRPSEGFQARVMAGVRVPSEMPWAARVKARLASLLPRPSVGHLDSAALQDLAEGVAGVHQATRARAHLETCAECSGELRSWEAVMTRLSGLDRLTPAEGFSERVMEGFRASRAAVPERAVARPSAARSLGAQVWAGARRFVPRTRKAWAAISGAAVTPAVTFALVLWAVFSHPSLTPQAFASFVFWQVSDLVVAGWTAVLSGGLELARYVGLDGLIEGLAGAPLLAVGGFLVYAVAFTVAVRILYTNLVRSRSVRPRYASASAS